MRMASQWCRAHTPPRFRRRRRSWIIPNTAWFRSSKSSGRLGRQWLSSEESETAAGSNVTQFSIAEHLLDSWSEERVQGPRADLEWGSSNCRKIPQALKV